MRRAHCPLIAHWSPQTQLLGRPADVDVRVLTFINDHRLWPLDALGYAAVWATTNSLAQLAVVVAFLVWVARRHQWRLVLRLAVAYLLSVSFAVLAKSAIRRARPPDELSLVVVQGSSMPSTHSAFTAAVATVVVLTYPWASRDDRRRAAVVAAAIVVALGFMLVYVGSHWPSDVVAGWVIGVPMGVLCSIPALVRARRQPATTP